MPRQPTTILVLGLPATGKTTLSHKIATQLRWPLLAKDDIKELLFDNLGWSNREWSMKLGRATYELMFHFVEQELKSGRSLVWESTFHPQFHNLRLQRLQVAYGVKFIQVLCFAEGQVLLDRFKQRSNTIKRHPGQDKVEDMPGFEEKMLKGKDHLLDIEGSVIEVDTTDFDKFDEATILKQISQQVTLLLR